MMGKSSVLLLALLCSPVYAGSWADALFSELHHDFGSIPRGADVRCRFTIHNPYQSPIRISGLKRTCGCTRVTLDGQVVLNQQIAQSTVSKVLAAGATSAIVVTLDTRKFIGAKSAQITVLFDQPSSAEVRLTVRSFIRQDVVLNPGTVHFGALTREELAPRSLDIEYAGRLDWRIERLDHANDHLEVKLEPWYRRSGQVGYRLTVIPKPSLPSGRIQDVIVLHTNDPATPQIRVLAEGQLLPELIVTPSKLRLGPVRPSQPAQRYVLLRGKKPFRVLRVDGCDDQFQADFVDRAQTFHTLTIRFRGSPQPGSFQRKLRIETDIEGEGPVEVDARAEVTL